MKKRKRKLPGKVLTIGVVRTFAHPVDRILTPRLTRSRRGSACLERRINRTLYTRVQFTKMALSAGARVFVYSLQDPNEFYGPYEGQGAGEKGTFWTPPMKGDGVVIEYFVPKGMADFGAMPFKISKVTHVHTDPLTVKAAGTCHNEVARSMGRYGKVRRLAGYCWGLIQWFVYRHSAERYDFKRDSLLADGQPLFRHADRGAIPRVYWNYNTRRDLLALPLPTARILLATGYLSDFTFVRLTGTVPGGLFFSGWDATTFSGTPNGTGIHHPNGSAQTDLFRNGAASHRRRMQTTTARTRGVWVSTGTAP